MQTMTPGGIAPDMASAESWTTSRRMQAAAVAERERVVREANRLAGRERALAAELESVRSARRDLEQQLSLLECFAVGAGEQARTGGSSRPLLRALPDTPVMEVAAGTLRGARIREVAVRLLVDASQPHEPVHYRDWFELVLANGYDLGGKDPLATFLTQIGRSPVVRRTTRAGVYVLDREFVSRAEAQLAVLRSDVLSLEKASAAGTVGAIAQSRSARAALEARIRDVERRLAEALRSLGSLEDLTREVS